MPIYCKKCGAELDADSVFCSECGEKAVNTEEIIEEESKSISKKMDKKWKITLIILTIVACISIVLVSIAILDIDMRNLGLGDKNENINNEIPESIYITASTQEGIFPLDVSFTSHCENYHGDIIFYCWDFGDGHQSIEENPVHLYEKAGTYEITLLVSDVNPYEAGANTSNAHSVTSAPISIVVRYEDEEFRSWIRSTFSDIARYSKNRLDALIDGINYGDYEMHKYWAEREKELHEKALSQIDNFKLSSSFESIRDDLKLAFENYIIAMDYYMQGDRDTGGYYEDIGTDYAEAAARKLGE